MLISNIIGACRVFMYTHIHTFPMYMAIPRFRRIRKMEMQLPSDFRKVVVIKNITLSYILNSRLSRSPKFLNL